MPEAVIVEAMRTPVGKRGGALARWHPVDLLGRTMATIIERSAIDPSLVDDVIAGVAMQHGHQSGNLARHAVLAAGMPESVPAVTIDRQCGSGQQAVSFAAQAIMAGSMDAVIACGVESMSQTPLSSGLVPGAALGPQYSPRELARYDGEMLAPGASSELMNEAFGLTRDELDAFARRSHERAYAAEVAGYRRDHLVAIRRDPFDPTSELVTGDEGVRSRTDPVRMAALPAAFAEHGGTTAANSSQLSDGAAALLITSEEFAARHGLQKRARFRALSVAAGDPIIQFTAVLPATENALSVAGLTVEQIDLFEVNEAFAGVPLMFRQHFGIPMEKLNVNGGSIAIGHPLGSTGARMLADLVAELERSGSRFGLQTICEASGTANTTIIERM